MDRKYEICQINISSHVDRVAAVCVAILISDKGRTSFFWQRHPNPWPRRFGGQSL